MKVFLSWSGEQSRQIALVLRDWLPCVMNAVSPWMSEADIDSGARWSMEIAGRLDESSVGIICLTSENINAPWILFEAGALSKRTVDSKVCTYLFDLRPSEISGPLAQFQASQSNKSDTLQLIKTLNRCLKEDGIPGDRLERVYETWWPELDSNLKKISSKRQAPPFHRSERDILEEILTLIRSSDRQISSVRPPPVHNTSLNQLKAVETSATRSEPQIIHIDLTPLAGPSVGTVEIPYVSKWSASDFLDELFQYVGGAVPAASYGQKWILRNLATGELMPNMGRLWAARNLNTDSDGRPLKEVGLLPGLRLAAVPITNSSEAKRNGIT